MNLTMVGKTLPVLISQVQEFIFDYNLERSINSTLNSQTTEGATEHEVNWNFPGLRKRRVVQQKEGSSRSRGGKQQPGIAGRGEEEIRHLLSQPPSADWDQETLGCKQLASPEPKYWRKTLRVFTPFIE